MTRLLDVRMFVEVEQFVDGFRIVALDDVNLLLPISNIVMSAKMLRSGVILVRDDAIDLLLRAVSLKLAAQHLDVGTIAVESIAPAVSRHKSMPLPDPVDKPIRIGKWKVSG